MAPEVEHWNINNKAAKIPADFRFMMMFDEERQSLYSSTRLIEISAAIDVIPVFEPTGQIFPGVHYWGIE